MAAEAVVMAANGAINPATSIASAVVNDRLRLRSIDEFELNFTEESPNVGGQEAREVCRTLCKFAPTPTPSVTYSLPK